MADYRHIIESMEGSAEYTSGFGDFAATTHLARVAVTGPNDETVWEKTLADRFISTAIPKPFFDRRLGRAAVRAKTLVARLNGGQGSSLD